MSDSRDFTGSYGRPTTGDIDGPAYWTAVVGQQELGLSRDQLYRSRQRLRSLSSGSWHCCLSLRVSAMVIAPTRLDLFILAPCIRSSALSRTLSAIFDTPLPREPGAVSRASPAKRGRLSKTLDTADGSPPWTAGRSGASSLSGIFWFTSTKARSSESYGEFN